MDEILKQYYEALGNDPKNYKRFNSFLDTLAEAESFSGKRQSSTKSSAKGFYHYLTNSVKTSDRRINNLSKRHYVDPKLKAVIDAQMKLPVDKRSRDMQSIMVLSDLMESPKAPYSAWQKGEVSDQELYYKGHHGTSSKAVSSQNKVYENWDNAATRLKNNKYELGGMTDPGKKKKKKLATAIKDASGIQFDDITAARLFGVNGEAPAPLNFGKYSKFFKEQGNTRGGKRSIIQVGKHYNDKAYKDIVYPYLQKQNPGVNMQYGDGGFGALLGEAVSGQAGDVANSMMGGLGGPFNLAAGFASQIGEMFMPKSDYNRKGGGTADFDFTAKHSASDGKQSDAIDSGFDVAGDMLGSIPLIGGFAEAGVTGLKAITKGIFGGKSSDRDIMDDYMAELRPEVQAQKKATFANAFAAMGGEFDPYLDLMDPDLKDAGAYEVGVGGTHEQNEEGGVTFGYNAQGGKNQAEEGEVIIDGPKGQKLVFTNKF